MNEPHCRRWMLLLFGSVVAGASGQTAVEYARALDCYHARRYSEARTRFGQVAVQRPADPEIDFFLGRLALWFDDTTAALAHLERAAQAVPTEARIQNALGDAYGLMAQKANVLAKLGWALNCRKAYERAVSLEPATPAYRWSLLGFYCVAPRLVGGGIEKARAEAAAIARLDPMEGRIARATLALTESRFTAAFAEFEEVLHDAPDDFIALYHIGRCAALSGREVDRGIRALQRCLELPAPDGDGMPTRACVHHRLGNLFMKKGETVAATGAFAAAQREHPDFRPQKIVLRN
jgi:tetratricopeptide (TPR) repeat protein